LDIFPTFGLDVENVSPSQYSLSSGGVYMAVVVSFGYTHIYYGGAMRRLTVLNREVGSTNSEVIPSNLSIVSFPGHFVPREAMFRLQ
jgi:hypothetical protein